MLGERMHSQHDGSGGTRSLQTGEQVSSVQLVPNYELLRRAKEGRIALIPRSFDEIQERLAADSGVVLPAEQIERLGLDGLKYQEIFDPNAASFLYFGLEEEAGEVIDSAVAWIYLERVEQGYYSGEPPQSHRLQPFSVRFSGVDSSTGRVIGTEYRADYQFGQSTTVSSFPHVIMPSPEFLLTNALVSVSFKEAPSVTRKFDSAELITPSMQERAKKLGSNPQVLVELAQIISSFSDSLSERKLHMGIGERDGFSLRVQNGMVLVFKEDAEIARLPKRLPRAS